MNKLSLLIFICIYSISCRTIYLPSDTDIENLRIAEEVESGDQSIEEMIAPYAHRLHAEMGEVIAQLEVDLTKDRPESTLGNWLSDMIYDELTTTYGKDIDFVTQNYGGVRIPMLSRGPVTIGEVYEIMPFDNKVSILTATGAQVKVLLDHIAADKGWPISKQLRFVISNDEATDITIKGEPIDMNKKYSFALPDYIANGGSGSDFLLDYDRIDMEVLIRDVFIKHLQFAFHEGFIESAELDGRLKISDHE